MSADLGLNPSSDGKVIRVPIPALTEERRRDLVKIAKTHGEEGRVAVRNARRDANKALDAEKKAKSLTEDEAESGQEEIQQLTDKYCGQIDAALDEKSKEIMEV